MTRKTRLFMGGSAAILVAGLGTGLVAYYGGGFPSLSASRSGPSELSYVPADAAVVAFANVREVMDSDLRQRLKLVMPEEQGQKEFAAADRHRHRARHRLHRRGDDLVGSSGVKEPNGLVVARGRFNTTQLETLAREHGGVVEEYKGKRLVKASATHDDTGTGDSPPSHGARVPRARPRRDRQRNGDQERHRRAAERAQHHQQQRNDGARLRHRPGQQRLGGRPLRRHREPGEPPRGDREQAARGQDLRGDDPHRRRRDRLAPRRDQRRRLRREPAPGRPGPPRARPDDERPEGHRADQLAAAVGHRARPSSSRSRCRRKCST